MSDEFTFYFGAASGSARKALQMMGEENVMISHATQNNTPWYGIENLFVDCGGYSMMKGKGEYGPLPDYVAYLRRHEPERYALRDYPCEPDLLEDLGRTVEEHQQMTVDASVRTLEAVGDIDSQPVTVLQGWDTRDYVSHIDDFRDTGLPLDDVALGSVCRRNAEADIFKIASAVRDELPDANVHAFGVKTSTFQTFPSITRILDSADSLAYDYRADQLHESKSWRDAAVAWWNMRKGIERMVDELDRGEDQTTLREAST